MPTELFIPLVAVDVSTPPGVTLEVLNGEPVVVIEVETSRAIVDITSVQGPPGEPGPAGPIGPTGETGPPVPGWYAGYGPPTDEALSEALDGSLYFDLDTADVYQKEE